MITIQGNSFIADSEFRPKIQRCLNLLNSRAKTDGYDYINTYNLTIRAARASGANFADNAIDIARATFNASDTWLASVLVHETVHFQQYRERRYRAGVPAEREANIYQLGVLRRIGAPASEVTHLQSQTGTHADLNGDGVYDARDYQRRNY